MHWKSLETVVDEIYEEIYSEDKKELKILIFFCHTTDGWKSIA
jgi:hypothetical protein